MLPGKLDITVMFVKTGTKWVKVEESAKSSTLDQIAQYAVNPI